MTELNASKAREIVDRYRGKTYLTEKQWLIESGQAEGFLEAHALAERVLVKALEQYKTIGIAENRPGDTKPPELQFFAQAALSEWRKANGE